MEVQRASPVAMGVPPPLAHLPPPPVPLFIASAPARQNNLAALPAPAPAPFTMPASPQQLPFAAPPSPQQQQSAAPPLPFAAPPSPQQLPFAAPPSPAPPTKAPVPFAKALHKMLGDAPQLIRLDAEEGCVVIPSPTALEGILGKYYRHSKYASFQRQLNNFGFHRQAGAGVTIYRRSPEAGGRIDSVDAILGIRHVVRRKAPAARPKPQLGDRYSAVSALLALKQSVAVIA